jgi:hypothetical protein
VGGAVDPTSGARRNALMTQTHTMFATGLGIARV